jgi:8-oxo-dGTP diphosphatase
LIQRKGEPFQGKWAIPGGYMEIDEALECTATREIEEETGLQALNLTQFHTFSALGRDPRGRTITAAYITFLSAIPLAEIKAADDAADARWFAIDALPSLAFDHQEILQCAIKDLRLRLINLNYMASYFDDKLSVGQLRQLAETITLKP